MWCRFSEADAQSVATFDEDRDGTGDTGEFVMDQCAGDHAGAAGESFILDAALIGADGDAARSKHFGEVGVGAFGLKAS